MTDTAERHASDDLTPDVSGCDALVWARAGFRPHETRAWRGAGAPDPVTASDWERYGFTPVTAGPWLAIGEVGPVDAITMSEAGMTSEQCARIRSHDPRCVNVMTDGHGQAHVKIESAEIEF